MERRRLLTPSTLSAVIVILSISVTVYAGDTEPVRADVTDADAFYLALHVLEQALANPVDFNLAQFNCLLSEEDRSRCDELVAAIHERLAAVSGTSPARLGLSLEGIAGRGDTVGVRVQALAQTGLMNRQRFFQIDFVPGPIAPVIVYPTKLLEQFGRLTCEAAAAVGADADRSRRFHTEANGTNSSSLVSNKLLLPKPIYGSYTRMTATVSQAEFDCQIFNRPSAVFAMVYDDPWNWLDHEFLFVADPNWNRIVASSKNPGRPDELHWLQAFGGYGTGTHQFNQLSGIAYVGQHWYVADGYNKRVQVYDVDWDTGEPAYLETLSGFGYYVADVAAARIPWGSDPINDLYQVAVLDQGNNRVAIYNYDGDFQRYFAIPGSNGTSLCFARSSYTHYPIEWIYITCAGNNRVVLMNTNDGRAYYTPQFMFPSDAYLTSVTVDGYGTVYVVDSRHSTVYVLTSGLDEVIATFGTTGTANNQLYWPQRFKIAEGWAYQEGTRNAPIILGDAFATEFYSTNTGVRRFKLGCDVLYDSLFYEPYWPSGQSDRVVCKWAQSGASESWRKVYCGSTLLKEVHDSLNLPWRHHYFQYNLAPEDPDSAWYRFTIRVKSKYGTTDTTFTDSLYVTRYPDPGARIVVEDKGVIDPTGEFEPYCLHVHPARWWRVYIDAYDNYYDSQLTFWWAQPDFGMIYSDTDAATVDYWYDGTPPFQCITPLCSLWLQITHFPIRKGDVKGDTSGTFITLRALVSVDPYSPEKWYDQYEWIDEVIGYGKIYLAPCYTPCTPPCPPPSNGCPMLYAWNGADYGFVDNLLPESEQPGSAGRDVEDSYPIYAAQPDADGRFRFLITEEEQEVSEFDHFSLELCQVPPGEGEVVLPDGLDQPVRLTGEPIAPVSAWDERGRDVLHLLTEEDGNRFEATGSGRLELEYEMGSSEEPLLLGPTPPSKMLYKPAVDGTEGENVITVYARDRQGNWVECRQLCARVKGEVNLTDLAGYVVDGRLLVRVAWTQQISLDWLPYQTYERIDCRSVGVELVDAIHSELGDVRSMLTAVDQEKARLRPGERLELVFQGSDPAVAQPEGSLLLFKAVGRYDRQASADGVQTARLFEFAQNYPNPFNPSTSFRFSLPTAAPVTLRIYNILGQEVATLVDGELAAGSHVVDWDGRDNFGRPLASGVFLAKLVAGEHTATRKVVVVK